jgi:hypothetical protein
MLRNSSPHYLVAGLKLSYKVETFPGEFSMPHRGKILAHDFSLSAVRARSPALSGSH